MADTTDNMNSAILERPGVRLACDAIPVADFGAIVTGEISPVRAIT